MKRLFCAFAALLMCLSFTLNAYASQKGNLVIDSKNISHEVSDTLYGVFLEDISFSCDGGLVSNLINNGSFEYVNKPDAGWLFSGVSAAVSNEKPMNSKNPTYEVITVNGEGVLENKGFPELYKYKTYELDESLAAKPDMGFKEGEAYDFSCYIRNVNFDGTISVSLNSKSNSQSLVSLPLDGVGSSEFTKVTATLKSAATEDGSLSVIFKGTGTLELDFVSLIPQSSHGYGTEEWKNTTLRTDLYDALKNLNPSFVRFPGGCLAEGTDLNNLYSWKNTIGAPEERKQDFNLWADDNLQRYYVNTNAMGYHEYFQLCEELGAYAVPVLNVGMVCQGRIAYDDHGTALKKAAMTDEEWRAYLIGERGFNEEDEEGIKGYTDWIDSLEIHSEEDYENWLDTVAYRPGTDEFKNYTQDVLDLIEYATGDSLTTYWGALRAANGHPEPFELKYIGLGNENWGELYFRNFKPLYKAIKNKYPDITVVSSAGTWLEGEGFDYAWKTINKKYSDTIVDEHYYTEQEYLFDHNDRYDSYDRSGAGVFIGEYSAKSPGFGTMITKTNLYTAIEEASFMTGFERNGDIVKMSSLAPTFAKVNANCWDINMIWFDSQGTALSADYYNQLLFSNNTGTKYIDSAFDTEMKGLYHSVTVDEDKEIIYVKLVSRDRAKKITLDLKNFGNINSASAQVLSHKYRQASNEVGKQRVAPREEELTVNGSTLDLELDADSVNVIRIAYGNNNGDNLYRFPEELDLETKSFIPVKTAIGIAVILLALAVGMAAGFFVYMKLIRKR